MKQTKFRVWDISRSCYHQGGGNVCLDLSGRLMWQFGFHSPELLSLEESKGYIIEQWIGLTDNNGVEMYEGDIVKFKNGSIHGPIEKGHWQLINKYIYGAYSVNGRGLIVSEDSYEFNGEVIGNIHENEDLLS